MHSTSKTNDPLKEQTYHLYNSTTYPFKNQTISHFALADSLMMYAGKHQQHLLHFWPTQNLIILGMMDTKLPHLERGLTLLDKAGKDVIVRNSGGLAVVGDEGVLNFSIILPERSDERIPIQDGYQVMFRLISAALKEYGKTIEAYEIEASYCPGEFDLSIGGKKFAGTAQRRLKNGVAIMIYISVNGNQERRAEWIRDFYQQGLQGETVKWHYPKVDPSVMATLEELLGVSLTVEEMKEKILKVLLEQDNKIVSGTYSEELLENYTASYQKMIRRNEQMLGDQLDRRLLD